MDSLKDLTSYLKTRSDGASFSELRNVFNDEGELKSFIKIGLENGVIQKEGEKRGTRYFVGKITKKPVNDENDFEQATSDIQVFLKSDKPCIGQPYFVTVTPFGESDKNLKKFLESGVVIRQTLIGYNKELQKNEIILEENRFRYIQVSFCQRGRNFIVTKYYAGYSKPNELEEFSEYEELREFIRINLS